MSAEWAEEPAVPTPEVAKHPGVQLAAARQALGWTVEQVAEQLKLARRQVIALEAGDHAALPGAVVVRGFVRAYAKIVKLDATPLVAMIEPDPPEPPNLQPAPREKKATFSEVRFPNMGERPFPFFWLIGAVVVAGLGFAVYKYDLVPMHLSTATPPAPAVEPASAPADQAAVPPVETTLLKADQELSAAQPAQTAAEMAAATPASTAAAPSGTAAATTAPSTTAPATAAPAATSPAAAPATTAPLTATAAKPDAAKADAAKTAPAAAVAAAATPATTAAAPAPAKPGANALVFTAKGESWVEVRSAATDKALFRRLMKAGSTDFVEVTEPVNVVVGKPEEINATLRGSAVELKPVTGGTTARLSLK